MASSPSTLDRRRRHHQRPAYRHTMALALRARLAFYTFEISQLSLISIVYVQYDLLFFRVFVGRRLAGKTVGEEACPDPPPPPPTFGITSHSALPRAHRAFLHLKHILDTSRFLFVIAM